jgi:pimeloyl-ACP methyl ester carboxylesterase
MEMDGQTAYRARRAPRESRLTLRGLAHRLLEWGPRDAPPTVLLHGYMDCADTFQFLVDELPEDRRLLALDLRGFGGSAALGAPYWFPDYLADFDALLDSLEPAAPVRLIGHSMGGNIVLQYAGVRPERVRSVVALEGFGLPRTAPEESPERMRRWLDALREPPKGSSYASIDHLAANLARRNPRLPPSHARFVAEAWTRPAADGGRELRFDPWHRLVNPVLYRREETEAMWRAVQAPVLMVLGGASELLQRLGPDGEEAAYRAHLARVEVATLPGLGHMLHHEDPRPVAAAIESWLARDPSA